jgi:hypothetical protein
MATVIRCGLLRLLHNGNNKMQMSGIISCNVSGEYVSKTVD